MLTTTVDGLWVLQVLSGIEVVAPELGLRPHFPSIETTESALAHPVSSELRDNGAITAGDRWEASYRAPAATAWRALGSDRW